MLSQGRAYFNYEKHNYLHNRSGEGMVIMGHDWNFVPQRANVEINASATGSIRYTRNNNKENMEKKKK